MKDVCVVFDVDDTLYLERDYVRSGFVAAGVWASERLGLADFTERCWAEHESGKRGRIFDAVLNQCGVPVTPELISALVSIYRTHIPDIQISSDAADTLIRLSARWPLAVITDGPAVSQSRKVEALRLSRYMSTILLTDTLGSEFSKPHPRAFLEVQRTVHAHRFVYVADNPLKDFIAPRELGWNTVRIRRSQGIHAALDGGGADYELADCGPVESLIEGFSRRG
jgi:putative hydrolase of the HAD superfamily